MNIMSNEDKFIVQDLESKYVARKLKKLEFEDKEYVVAVVDFIAEDEKDFKVIEEKVNTNIGVDNMVIIDLQNKKCLDEEKDNKLYYHILAKFYE